MNEDHSKFTPDERLGHPINEKRRIDYPRRIHQEEYAADIAPTTSFTQSNEEKADPSYDNHADAGGRTSAYIGLALGIASLFVWSIILGPIAAVLGFYAYSQGSKTTGMWAAALGVISILAYFVLIPFTR
ncbi:hypothetical protein J2Z69_000206 [Paenibacillus shirakamiensis]|uniref:DUF4190 domain-containing protein n=1 Tax=Paenibacillus shirakamiensis TaxID=1265935 RepID=A0ABS4JBU6_9BACL|nr:hypothetical protein [Paenibacillus shirakamiensis]MBP1999187.1 hypothetical protein [Paenibacillus shirakamiensis]